MRLIKIKLFIHIYIHTHNNAYFHRSNCYIYTIDLYDYNFFKTITVGVRKKNIYASLNIVFIVENFKL